MLHCYGFDTFLSGQTFWQMTRSFDYFEMMLKHCRRGQNSLKRTLSVLEGGPIEICEDSTRDRWPPQTDPTDHKDDFNGNDTGGISNNYNDNNDDNNDNDNDDLSNPEGKDGPDAGVGGQGSKEAQQACHQHADHKSS